MTTTTHRNHPANNGGKWIRPEKRLAIYLRDGMACVYCGSSVEGGVVLTLDHVKPYSKGGDNGAGNLVCACKKCNSSRGNRPVATFVRSVAEYLGEDTGDILRHIRNCRSRRLDIEAAKEIINRRG